MVEVPKGQKVLQFQFDNEMDEDGFGSGEDGSGDTDDGNENICCVSCSRTVLTVLYSPLSLLTRRSEECGPLLVN